ncbi:MAG TPA: poly-beta-1,6-N-acetyl-D-glucosamine N-deacetylase PgaB [Burkholderiales bacterium]|jgi:biofilm PGA synthesis lipoprotein PgaB
MAFLIPLRRLFVLVLMALAPWSAAQAADDLIVLCYHEVESGRTLPVARTAVLAAELAAQFAWLRSAGYTPVSLQQVIDARRGGKVLPEKAVLLTFDDGKKDVYTRVYPLLKLFRYPAVIALVGRWLEVPEGGQVDYDGQPVPRGDFVTWEEAREMQRSGLVEVVSHSYDLHRGVPGNPQGNTQPAATTRIYADGRYETDEIYLKRLRDDLVANRDLIARRIGVAPRGIAWPYGRSNHAAQEIAAQLGMSIGFTLEDGVNTAATPLMALKRNLIERGPTLEDYAAFVRRIWPHDPSRSVRIQPAQWGVPEERLSRSLDVIERWSPNVTFVEPGAAELGLLNRVAWQVERRAGGEVFIDLPQAWLEQPALLDDLARRVNFSGVRVPALPGDQAVTRALATIERWRSPMRIAYAPGTRVPPEAWDRLRIDDFVVLPANPDMLASIEARHRSRVLFEFDPSAIPAPRIASEMRRLEADGFRQFGVAGLPDNGFEAVWRALSLRSQPALP